MMWVKVEYQRDYNRWKNGDIDFHSEGEALAMASACVVRIISDPIPEEQAIAEYKKLKRMK